MLISLLGSAAAAATLPGSAELLLLTASGVLPPPKRGAPVRRAEDDVYTNHIHADDLSRTCIAALHRGCPQRAIHVCDDAERTMGEHFDLVARLAGLPPPPRISRAEAIRQLSPASMSFLSESRRLGNRRLKSELRVRLRYPDIEAAFRSLERA